MTASRTDITFARSDGFSDFVAHTSAPFLEAVSEAASVNLRVVDADGNELFSSAPPSHEDPSGPAPMAEIEVDGEVFGSLIADRDGPGVAPLLTALAGEIGERFVAESDLDRMTERLSVCYEELSLLFRLTRAPESHEQFPVSCRRRLRETSSLTEEVNLVLFLEEEQIVEACSGDADLVSPEVEWLLRHRESLRAIHAELIEQAESDPRAESTRITGDVSGPEGPIPYIASPIRSRNRVAGFVGLFKSARTSLLRTGDVRLAECLAAQLSGDATTRELYNELKGVLLNTVRGLVAAIEAKDPYTKGHSERVYRLSIRIGERLGLSADALQTLTWSSLLHDIGKIAIPSRILRKPTPLTDEEYEIIKTHPERGCKVLEPIPQLRAVLPGIRHHHERHDGRGYPAGLGGHEIPLLARVIAVADAYDAMVTTRAYRDARPPEVAIQEIRTSAGTQLDPEVVAAFLELARDGDLEDVTRDPAARDAA